MPLLLPNEKNPLFAVTWPSSTCISLRQRRCSCPPDQRPFGCINNSIYQSERTSNDQPHPTNFCARARGPYRLSAGEISPNAQLQLAAYYRKTGNFPRRGIGERGLWNGSCSTNDSDAYWAKGIKVWFVQVKDTQHRFPNNKLWGDGWAVSSSS